MQQIPNNNNNKIILKGYLKILYFGKKMCIFSIRLYQVFLSPLLGIHKCRFTPSCSEYSIQAIKKYGIIEGIWLGIKRISRCHPWGGSGYDPIK
ncbi:MAG: membrane protein insertion efficiency factor YidD [Chitinophagaceae bacterium]